MNQITPPHNVDIEKVVLASMMQSDEEITEYGCDQLTEADFYNSNNKIVFKCIQGMVKSSVGAMDIVLVQDAISGLEGMTEESSMLAIADLIGVQTTRSIVKHCERLRELAESRSLLNLSYQMQNSVIKGEQSAVIKEAVDVELLSMERSTKCKTTHIRESIGDTIEQMDGNSDKNQPLYFGIKDLDKMTGGMFPGNLVTIGARPSQGKTQVCLQVALNVAKQGKTVLIFSLEMKKEQLVSRYISNIGSVDNSRIRSRTLMPKDREGVMMATEQLNDLPIYLNSSKSMTVYELRSEARRMKRKIPNLGLIIVDYLQLMEDSKDLRGDKRLATEEKSKILLQLGDELEVPIMPLVQLNRNCESRPHPNKRPILSDIKEAGAIEQDSHIVIFLYQGAKYKEVIDDVPVPEGELELILAKVREGTIGTVKTLSEGQYSRVSDLEEHRVESDIFGGRNEDEFTRGV